MLSMIHRGTLRTRLVGLVSYCVLFCLSLRLGLDVRHAGYWLLIYSYQCAAALAVVAIARSGAGAMMTALARGALLSVAFVAAPSALFSGEWVATSIVIGAETALSAYSFLSSESAGRERIEDALFFILVDPVLVYSRRSAPAPGTRTGAGALRVALGAASLVASSFIFSWNQFDVLRERLTWWNARDLESYAKCMLSLGLAATSLYAAHSGLASVRVGLMTMAGWSVAEAYRFPWRASSPRDFWRRWNRWYGDFVEQHLFVPAWRMLSSQQRLRSISTVASTAIAFVSMGVFHDLCGFLRAPFVSLQVGAFAYTLLFLGFALLSISWHVAKLESRLSAPLGRLFGRLMTIHLFLILFSTALPYMVVSP